MPWTMACRRFGNGGPEMTTLPSFLAPSLKRAHWSALALKNAACWPAVEGCALPAGADCPAWAAALDGCWLGLVWPLAAAALELAVVPDPQAAAATATAMRTPHHIAFTLAPPARSGNRSPFYWRKGA